MSVRASVYYPVAHPGALEVMSANIRQVRDGLLGRACASADEIDEYLTLAENRMIDLTTPPLISVAARMP